MKTNVPKQFRSVGLYVSREKSLAKEALQRAARLVRNSGMELKTDVATAQAGGLKAPTLKNLAELSEAVDLLLVIGGDGTMLSAARGVSGSGTPMLGVKAGGLGFLTDVQPSDLAMALRQLNAGEFSIEERPLIRAQGTVAGQSTSLIALNDFVIAHGTVSRLIELDVFVNEEQLTQYRCDGLILSSPTGSTAYSLAAGGAVVSPDADVLTITPICPHTLSNRSVVVRLDSLVRVRALSERVDMVLTADGQEQLPLQAGDEVVVRKSARKVRLVRLPGSSFFATLRHKLNWRGSNVNR